MTALATNLIMVPARNPKKEPTADLKAKVPLFPAIISPIKAPNKGAIMILTRPNGEKKMPITKPMPAPQAPALLVINTSGQVSVTDSYVLQWIKEKTGPMINQTFKAHQ